MKVLYYEVGKEVDVLDIDNNLETFQKLVGGYIEAVPLPDIMDGKKFYLIMNEEGVQQDLELNRGVFVGNLFVVAQNKDKEEEFRGLEKEEAVAVNRAMDIVFPPAPSFTKKK
ncbi:DUF3846 domain-containing protein [Bacillus megaterium]|jgi:hypothetical protein|nr:DUF3846 domain-containing protein [Priestia megaterium]